MVDARVCPRVPARPPLPEVGADRLVKVVIDIIIVAFDELRSYTTNSGVDDGDTIVARFGNLDFETFTWRAGSDVGVIREGFQGCMCTEIRATSWMIKAVDPRPSPGGILTETTSLERR